MNAALATTALLMGLAGAPHCAAMCGPACAGVLRGCGGSAGSTLAFHAGRLASYAAGGALAAGSLAWLATQGPQVAVLRPLWTLLQVAAVALGLWLLWRGRQPAWIETIGTRLSRPAATGRVIWLHAPARAGAAGALWVAWPCGLLQSALVVSALGGSALGGATLMLLFGAGSALGLWLGPALWLRLAGRHGALAQSAAVRLAGALLALASGWALWHGIASAMGGDYCLVPGA
ncbi:MAG: sulfite exporter TauE/SafE family protein [Piscinibacter sp.]|uniref:sulfite exporter TauE/SafE family protein n=1 Tax=Piscinibacter sp. TaxID=1903157 RepID=UPI0025826344|nr:sulfite exporter TauE/SafE family protein [Piscinibacter sp.]MCW5663950.1 sulfite exporter TauE/SafE family protein [Piscinibacter sp.]